MRSAQFVYLCLWGQLTGKIDKEKRLLSRTFGQTEAGTVQSSDLTTTESVILLLLPLNKRSQLDVVLTMRNPLHHHPWANTGSIIVSTFKLDVQMFSRMSKYINIINGFR